MSTIVKRKRPDSGETVVSEVEPGQVSFFSNEPIGRRLGRMAYLGMLVHCTPFDLQGNFYVCRMTIWAGPAQPDEHKVGLEIVSFIRSIRDEKPQDLDMAQI